MRLGQTIAAPLALLAALSTSGAIGACASDPQKWDTAEAVRADVFTTALSTDPAPPAGELRVRLAFGGVGDLDLYVTGPLQETVYYARREARSGGRFEADARCDAETPRIETVRFPAAAPGRYRIGVDYALPCSEGAGVAAFAVQVELDGEREVRIDRIRPVHFEPVVWEFDVDGPVAQER